jgi:hypothetical protein
MSIHTYTPPPKADETCFETVTKPDSADEAQAKRGWLNNGNPPGDFTKAPRCGAKTRRGTPCMGPAMTNGRCRMHGGCSTGPRTPAGLKRSRNARFRHGQCSAKARAEHSENVSYLAWARRFFNLAERSDRLFLLLDEIPKQIDANEPKGLAAKCALALRLWREYQTVMKEVPVDKRTRARWQKQDETDDRRVSIMLEAGAIGAGPFDIRQKLAAALSFNRTLG